MSAKAMPGLREAWAKPPLLEVLKRARATQEIRTERDDCVSLREKTNREKDILEWIDDRISSQKSKLKMLNNGGYGNSIAAGMAMGYIEACEDFREQMEWLKQDTIA